MIRCTYKMVHHVELTSLRFTHLFFSWLIGYPRFILLQKRFRSEIVAARLVPHRAT
jgi:hypothetical protein